MHLRNTSKQFFFCDNFVIIVQEESHAGLVVNREAH